MLNLNELSFEDFLKDSSAQSIGKFGEFLFAKFCDSKKIKCNKEHENGVDFIINNNIKIDVKAVRSLKSDPKDKFRRVVIEKQLPNVHYAYLIFWKKSIVELRVEINDAKYGGYDCFIDSNLLAFTWTLYDKKSIKFIDRLHVEITKKLKNDLTNWIADNLNVKARVIQRKVNSSMNKRGDGEWGADNFYDDSNKHKIVVLLAVEDGNVAFIHSYPANEHMHIPKQLKQVGTNAVEIWCYKPNLLPKKYIFKDIDDFKLRVKERFGL